MSIHVTDKTDGQIAYETYWTHTHGRSLTTNDHLPRWKDLPTGIQDAWRAVGTTLRHHIAQQVRENT